MRCWDNGGAEAPCLYPPIRQPHEAEPSQVCGMPRPAPAQLRPAAAYPERGDPAVAAAGGKQGEAVIFLQNVRVMGKKRNSLLERRKGRAAPAALAS